MSYTNIIRYKIIVWCQKSITKACAIIKILITNTIEKKKRQKEKGDSYPFLININ